MGLSQNNFNTRLTPKPNLGAKYLSVSRTFLTLKPLIWNVNFGRIGLTN